MARIAMVTRTIITTEVTVMAVNLETAEVFNETLRLPRTYKDDKALMKKIQSVFDNAERKAVQIVDKKEVETIYGMLEDDFIKSAKELDPKTRKAIAE